MENSINPKEFEKADRRAFPRKACLFECGDKTITDISVGGIRLESSSPLDKDQKVDLSFMIPAIGSVRGSGQVTRVEEISDSVKKSYGAKFVSLTGKDQKKIKHYILNRVKKDELGDLRRRFLSSDKGNVVEISDISGVTSLLQGVMEKRAKLTIFQDGTLDGYLEGTIRKIDDGLIQIVLDKNSRTDALSFASPFSVYFDYLFHGYFFETRLDAIPEGELHLRNPLRIYYSDKRRAKRITVSDGTFEFPIPHPVNATFKAKLLDYSETGASFVAPMSGFYFLPDTPLKPVKITASNVKKEGLRGEVRHLVPLDHDHYKVGVEFATSNRRGFEIDRPKIPTKTPLIKLAIGLMNRLRIGAYLTVGKKLGIGNGKAEQIDYQAHVVKFRNPLGQEIVGLLNSTMPLGKGRITAPVVIIPPAYTKRKETTSALALTLIHNFKKQGKDLIVIRIDLTNATGESYIDPENRLDGKNYINFTTAGAANDILATINYCESNPLFSASKMAVVTFSFTAPMARKAILKDNGQHVKYWINAMGTPHLQELIKNSGGGIDYVGNYAKGMRFGTVNFLGELVNMDNFCHHITSSGMAFLDEARSDMEYIDIPVTWIYGKYDSWVNPKSIKDVMSIKSNAPREVVEVPTGHLPTSTEEAFNNFRLITSRVWRYLVGGDIVAEEPDLLNVMRARESEWDRIPKTTIGDSASYWKSYLLGESSKDVGYDILSLTDEYRQLMKDQIAELDLKKGLKVADIGAGTGNFLKILSESTKEECHAISFEMMDFIPEVLERAKEKHDQLPDASSLDRRYRLLNLELSRLLPVMSFLAGELADITLLKGRIEGLTDHTLQMWKDRYSNRLHQILRGKAIEPDDLSYLDNGFGEGGAEKILEFNQISQLATALKLNDMPLFESLLSKYTFEHLIVRANTLKDLSCPLESDCYDRIISSIVVSYVFDPIVVVKEMHRCLKPGGKLVLSSFRADSDMTMSYANLIRKIEDMSHSPFPNVSKDELLAAARQYANNAAKLLRLGEEGAFHFFTEDQLKALLLDAGFKKINIRKSFGMPAQVVIVSGLKL